MQSQINIKSDKLQRASLSTDLHAMKGPRALAVGALSQHLILALAAASPAPPIILPSDNAIQNGTMPSKSFETVLENFNITVSSDLTKTTLK